MNILITGGTGLVGTALIGRLLAKGHKVYSVSRHAPELKEGLVALKGDILEPDFGIPREIFQEKIDACYHLAAILNLGQDKDGMIWKTNVTGTKNVIDYCIENNINDLKFCSTAYVADRNVYERSKALCEVMVEESSIPKVTIFKPSIIMGTPEQHFSQFVSLLIRVHRRAELIRRKIEGTLRLPVIEPVFRIKGNPKGRLNLVTVDAVAEAMATIENEGVYWLTNPNPPTLSEIVEWVGEFIMVRLTVEPEFKPTPLELAFERMARAFTPYLWGDDFPSNLQDIPPVTKEFIQDTVKRTLVTTPSAKAGSPLRQRLWK